MCRLLFDILIFVINLVVNGISTMLSLISVLRNVCLNFFSRSLLYSFVFVGIRDN